MFIIYPKISASELRKKAKEVIPKIDAWFENNPRRRICRAELWYGRQYKIRRKDVAVQIHQIVETIIRERR